MNKEKLNFKFGYQVINPEFTPEAKEMIRMFPLLKIKNKTPYLLLAGLAFSVSLMLVCL